MTELTSYALDDGIATITLDDGKVNALSPAMIASISKSLDRAAADEAVVIVTGRATTLSAGFDLRVPPEDFLGMVAKGARLAEKMLRHPRPIVAACNGNAIAMGAFLLLASDVRVGAEGAFKIGLNEVAIGLTLPWFGVELARHRLSAPYFDRCTVTGALLAPAEAQAAGFLDHLASDALETARELAGELKGLNMDAHAATKLRTREQVIKGVTAGCEQLERGEF